MKTFIKNWVSFCLHTSGQALADNSAHPYLPRPLSKLALGVSTGARPRWRGRDGKRAPIRAATTLSSSKVPPSGPLLVATTRLQQAS